MPVSGDAQLGGAATGPEATLVAALSRFLVAGGYRVRLEVSNMGQSADLVATRGRWVTCIEAKVKDWRTAIRQCVAHEAVADFVCIAVALRRNHEPLVEAARARGYGVIACDPASKQCGWILAPRRNLAVWAPQRKRMTAAMKEVGYAR